MITVKCQFISLVQKQSLKAGSDNLRDSVRHYDCWIYRSYRALKNIQILHQSLKTLAINFSLYETPAA